MSIKSKIQSLIAAANAKTGESDTTLTDAVQTLVDGYGQGGGGGMSWELIADYTSDANAEIVKALIPSGKQDSNVYKFQYNSNGASLYYAYIYANDTKGGYFSDGSRAVNCIGYVTKKPADNNSEVGGSSDPSAFTVASPRSAISISSPFENVGIQAYSGRTIPSGFNIKVWRLVES